MEAYYNVSYVSERDIKALKKKIKKSVYLFVSEDYFDEAGWLSLINAIKKNNKISSVTFQALTISSKNIKYLTEVITSAPNLQILTFSNYDVQGDAFNEFCSTIRNVTINKLQIATNDLSQSQIKQLQSSMNPGIKESELICEPVHVSYNNYIHDCYYSLLMDDESGLHNLNKRFALHVKEVIIPTTQTNWSVAKAIQNSPLIESISLVACNRPSESLINAICQNTSIKMISVSANNLQNNQDCLKKLLNTNRITHITINGQHSSSYAIVSLKTLLASPSLKSVTMNGFDESKMSLFYLPNNVTELRFIPSEATWIAVSLELNREIKVLHLAAGTYLEFNKLSYLISKQLTRLTLDNVEQKDVDICQLLKESSSLTELTLVKTKNYFDEIASILEDNSTLKSLTLNVKMKNDEAFFQIFAEDLKKNKTLTHLDLSLPTNHYNVLSQALKKNITLTSLRLDGPEPNPVTNAMFYSAMAKQTNLRRLETDYWPHLLRNLCRHKKSNLQSLKMHVDKDTQIDPLWADLIEWLTKNKSLIEVSVVQKDVKAVFNVEIPLTVEQLLQRNRVAYHDNINKMYSFLTTMKLRPESFDLPPEIWVLILKRINFPGCRINFAEKYIELLNTRN